MKGYKLTVQGSERYVKRYAAMPSRRKSGLDMAKQGSMASQLAQLGLAAASRVRTGILEIDMCSYKLPCVFILGLLVL
jgi:hypothetical protein